MKKFEYIKLQGSNFEVLFMAIQQHGTEGYRLHTLTPAPYDIRSKQAKITGDGLYWIAVMEREVAGHSGDAA